MSDGLQREHQRWMRAEHVLGLLRELWGDAPPPGANPELTLLVDALSADDAQGRQNGYVVHGDEIRYSDVCPTALPEVRTGAWTLDPATGKLSFDITSLELLGVPDADSLVMLDDVLAERLHPDDRVRVGEALARTAQTGEPYRAVYRSRLRGGWQWITSVGRLVRPPGADAVVIGFLVVHT